MDTNTLLIEMTELATTMDKKQLAFCYQVLAGQSNSQAYKEAGYKAKTEGAIRSGASALLKKPNVAAYLATVNKLTALETVKYVTEFKRSVIDEFSSIGLSNLKRHFSPSGEWLSLDQLNKADAAAVKSMKEKVVKTITDDEGKPVAEVIEREYQLWNKPKALEAMAKLLHL